MLKFACYACGKKYGVPDEFAGKKMKCKKCGTPNLIPQPPRREYLLGKDEDSLPSVLDLDCTDREKEKVFDGLVGLPVDFATEFKFKCERCKHDITARLGQSGYIDCPNCGCSQLIPLRQAQSAKRMAKAAAATGTHPGMSTGDSTRLDQDAKPSPTQRKKKKLDSRRSSTPTPDDNANEQTGDGSGKTRAQARAAAKAKARARAKAKARKASS